MEMAVVIEKTYGRAKLIECMCDQRLLLSTYNQAAAKQNRNSRKPLALNPFSEIYHGTLKKLLEGVTLDDGAHRMTFIRAPAIRSVGTAVEVLARLRGEAVVVEQANVIATNGHPELVGDAWLHERAFRRAA